jgi:hypothetical protein
VKQVLCLIVRRLRGTIQTASRSGVVAKRNVYRQKGTIVNCNKSVPCDENFIILKTSSTPISSLTSHTLKNLT